jgi:hypothetical protein
VVELEPRGFLFFEMRHEDRSPSLQRFVIHFNGFSGPLTPWLPKLTNLRIADFGLNHFSGPFPNELGGALNTLQNL